MRRIIYAFIILFSTTQSYGTTWTVTNSGFTFSPDSITINQGDTVSFVLGGIHNAEEVSQSTWNIPATTPVTGFQTALGGGIVTGLTTGTHYYVCVNHGGSGMKGRIFVKPALVIPNVWINEIHYDNAGTDSLEGYEIAGPAGTNLTCYRVFLYTGTGGGTVYSTDTLTGVIPDQACGLGTVWFLEPTNGMQNGPNDGIVLEYAPTALQCGVNNQDTILQFLSYEGVLTPANGRAIGLTSTDIGVSESSATPVGNSLQLSGAGTSYSQFTWNAAAANTYNQPNTNQLFCGPNPSVEFVITSSSYSEGVGTFNLAVSITNPNANSTSVDVNVVGGGTATSGVDYTYSPLTITFPANSTFTQNVTVTVIDDQIAEGNESFTFQLAFPTNNATVGTNGQTTVTIIDNDTLQLNIYPHSQSQFENIGQVNIPVLLNHTSPNATSVTVHLVATGTTATQGSDFFFNDTTITWAAGTSGTIQVPVNVVDDALFEPDETARFQLTNATNGATFLNDTFLLVILNNDTLPSGNCSDLFFSEYIEGSSNNKALEIFNPTNSVMDLSNYRIFKSINGGSSTAVFGLSGLLASKGVYVAANGSADTLIKIQADTLSGFFNFNGNDALALLRATDTIDIIGQLGVDPGTGWAVDTGSTFHHTLIRNFYTYHGDTSWSNAAETWNAYRSDMFDSLGFHHTAPCGTPVPVPKATIHFISSGVTVPESIGTVPVIVEVNNPTGSPVTFFFAHNNASSTATVNLDYNFPIAITYTNGAGISYDTFPVIILEDQIIEPTESVVIYLNVVSNNGIVTVDSIFNLNITDNDVLTVSFNGAGFSYVEADTLVQVKITLNSPVPDTTSVLISLAAGNATNGVDFNFNDTIVTFLPNSNDTQSVWVHIIDDTIVEPNEQINFNMTNATNGAVIAISAYTLTIIDNDSPSGIDEIDLSNSIKMYPNPVMNSFIIQTETDLNNVSIMDITGNAVMNLGKLSTGKNVVDVSSLSAGMYFIHVFDEHKTFSKRFVKQD